MSRTGDAWQELADLRFENAELKLQLSDMQTQLFNLLQTSSAMTGEYHALRMEHKC